MLFICDNFCLLWKNIVDFSPYTFQQLKSIRTMSCKWKAPSSLLLICFLSYFLLHACRFHYGIIRFLRWYGSFPNQFQFQADTQYTGPLSFTFDVSLRQLHDSYYIFQDLLWPTPTTIVLRLFGPFPFFKYFSQIMALQSV